MSSNKRSFPPHWETINLFDVCQPKQWKVIPKSVLSSTGYAVYGANGIIGHYHEYTHEKPTIMIGCRGSCGGVIVSKPLSYINGNAMALDNLSEEIVSLTFLARFLQSRGFKDVITGSSQPQITQESLKKVQIGIPPLAEQTRIAAKLDELLAQVDTLKARIDGIPALLKRFRQSVLTAAVAGRLTEEWRAGNSNPGWSEIKLEDLLAGAKDGICRGPFGSSIKKEYFVSEGYKVYEQKNAIRDNSLIGEYFVDEKKYKELERFSVRSGDFIVSCAGTLGRISLLPPNAPAGLINQALIRIRTNKKLVLDRRFSR